MNGAHIKFFLELLISSLFNPLDQLTVYRFWWAAQKLRIHLLRMVYHICWTFRLFFPFECSLSKFISFLQQETSRQWLFFFFLIILFSWKNRQQYKLHGWLPVCLRPYKVQASSCKLWIWVLKMKRSSLPKSYILIFY